MVALAENENSNDSHHLQQKNGAFYALFNHHIDTFIAHNTSPSLSSGSGL
jgi:hypothetical protein